MQLFIAQLLSRKVIGFLLVGGSATLLQFVLLITMVEWLTVNKVAASAVSYLLSSVYNYLLNYYQTFQSKQSHWQTLPKFVVVVAVGVVVNTAVFAVTLLLMPYLIAQVIAVLAALISNFLLHKFWIYRTDS